MIEKNVYIKIRAKVRMHNVPEGMSDQFVESSLIHVVNELDYRLNDTTGEAAILDTEVTDFEIIPEDN